MLWPVLIQFLFRLAFGLTLAMSLTSPKDVTAGFFRVHLWVALGLHTFAVSLLLLVPNAFEQQGTLLVTAVSAAVLSYLGAAIWLYEIAGLGRIFLCLVSVCSLAGALLANQLVHASQRLQFAYLADTIAAGLLLGATFSAMLLGHWYLNSPSMKMAPLRKLIILMLIAVVARLVFSLLGFAGSWEALADARTTTWALFGLRFLSGIVGVAVLAAMSWQTLKIPNTQSATGILYVAVIFAFLGELTAQLLSLQTPYPV